MIDRQFDAIDKSDIDRLIANGVPEGRSLEYKESLPGGSDSERKEFLADVSSLANATGGDLIYGIRERRDESNKATSIPESAEGVAAANRDVELQRLENMLRDGVAPRIAGVRYRWIDDYPAGAVLVVRVPRSWSGPHMVTFQQLSRFFSRGANGKYLLDVGQLRDAFLHGGALAERARAFRVERLAQIMAGDTPARLSGQVLIIVHAIPHVSLGNDALIDVRELAQHADRMRPFYADSESGQFNIDGFLTTVPTGRSPTPGYAQLFRSGIVETVDSAMFQERESPRTGFALPSLTFARRLFDFIIRTRRLYATLDVPPPVSISVVLYGATQSTLGVADALAFNFGTAPRPFGREVIRLPELLLTDLEEGEVTQLARPLLDALWQGAGLQFCHDYDTAGKWKGR
jgi:hypothetical protein